MTVYVQLFPSEEFKFKYSTILNRAFLAQMVERWPFKPMVVGSIPTEGAFFLHHFLEHITQKNDAIALIHKIIYQSDSAVSYRE